MKILLFGDASNFHNSLATALRRLGHNAVVVSDGSRWMNTDRDIDLSRGEGLIGAIRYVTDVMRLLPSMRGYDVVHLINPIFLRLRPQKVRWVFDFIRRNNRCVLLSAIGDDYDVVKANLAGDVLAYSECKVGDKLTEYARNESLQGNGPLRGWFTDEMRQYHRHFIDNIDGAVACLYEYYKIYNKIIPEKLAYGGIPIDTRQLKAHYIENEPEKVRFFIGIQRGRSVFKGTDRLLVAAKCVAERMSDKCEVVAVENVPYREYVERINTAHVLLDQLYSYTPATNALIAMAQGMVAVSGGENEYYDFIGENQCRPIVNVSPLVEGDIENKLLWIVQNKHLLPQLSRMSRDFVVKHNDCEVVAHRHIDFWNRILKEKGYDS